MFQILVLNHGKGLEVKFHPGVKPRSVPRGIQGHLVKMLGDQILLITILLRNSVKHQLLVNSLLGILLEILEDDIQTWDIVIRPIHVLDSHICGHLGERLQKLCEGQIVLIGYQFCILSKKKSLDFISYIICQCIFVVKKIMMAPEHS